MLICDFHSPTKLEWAITVADNQLLATMVPCYNVEFGEIIRKISFRQTVVKISSRT